MSRQVPIFRITLDNTATSQDVEKNPYIREIVMNELICAVKDGLKKKKRDISLFIINDSEYMVSLDKKQWKPSLESALTHYENLEEYHKCFEIKNIIDSL
jgi:hypothetical protein